MLKEAFVYIKPLNNMHAITTLFASFLRCLPPETAHDVVLKLLRLKLLPTHVFHMDSVLLSEVAGLSFPNPVGLAAGFDKNAVAVDGLLGQGFGFVEAGTVTPLAQMGNPTPRIFRLLEGKAVINRLGFNNQGVHAFVANMKRHTRAGIVGANISRNRDSLDAVQDYITTLHAVYPYVSYITVNISSPNTVGLRDLQQKELLSALIKTLTEHRNQLAIEHGMRKPIFYKIAPDIDIASQEAIASVALEWMVDGLILTNTTVMRPDTLRSPYKREMGGLSGAPPFHMSTDILRSMYTLSQGKIPLIGVGGVASGADAYHKIKAGASLIQLYTALVYQGFGLVRTINHELVHLLQKDGFTHIKQAIGVESGL